MLFTRESKSCHGTYYSKAYISHKHISVNTQPITSPNCHDIAWIRLRTPLSSYYNILSGVRPPPYSRSLGAGYGQTGTGTGPVQSSCTSTYSRFGPDSCTFSNPGQWICVDAIRANGKKTSWMPFFSFPSLFLFPQINLLPGGACRGDSGGPLTACQLVGVTSFFYGPSSSCFTQIRSVYASVHRYASVTQSVVNRFGGCN